MRQSRIVSPQSLDKWATLTGGRRCAVIAMEGMPDTAQDGVCTNVEQLLLRSFIFSERLHIAYNAREECGCRWLPSIQLL
jgi:hypothetical protein